MSIEVNDLITKLKARPNDRPLADEYLIDEAIEALTRLSEQRDEAQIAQLKAKNASLYKKISEMATDAYNLTVRAEAAEAKLTEAAKDFEAIKQATIAGRVCDDVAWFDEITTLHDFCAQAIDVLVSSPVTEKTDG